VSKRTRGSARVHRRPGARPAGSRSTARRREAAPPTAADANTPVVDAQAGDALTGESAVAPTREPLRRVEGERTVPRANPRSRVKPGSLLAARAATEYVYVSQDLKRISLVGGLLFATLFVLWLLIVYLRVIPLPFY
jgi:hypothetical protein